MGVIYKGDIPLGVGVGGVSAYEAAVAAGYTGTAEQFSAKLAASTTTVTFTANISTTWTGSGPYAQTVTVSPVNGYTVLAADNPIIDIVLPTDPTAANAILDAWGKVSKIETIDGGIVVTCNSVKPTVVIPIQIKTVRVNTFRSLVTPDNIVDIMATSNVVEELGILTNTNTMLTEAKTYSATLTTSWAGSAPYTQTVSVAGILATDNPVIDVVLTADTAASKLILEAWSNVSRIMTANGSITAYCYEDRPAVAIPLQIKVVR